PESPAFLYCGDCAADPFAVHHGCNPAALSRRRADLLAVVEASGLGLLRSSTSHRRADPPGHRRLRRYRVRRSRLRRHAIDTDNIFHMAGWRVAHWRIGGWRARRVVLQSDADGDNAVL